MPINIEVASMINQHLPFELAAHHAYARMSLDANRLGYFGVEKYFAKQSAEERGHLLKFIEFINDFDAPNAVPAAEAEPVQYTDCGAMFQMALTLEQTVTARVNVMLTTAMNASDWQSFTFLQWFATEQTSSEIEIRDILNRLKVAGANLIEFDEWIAELVEG